LQPAALQAQPKEVEIAIIDGLTGPYSANGSRVIKGAEMAAEEINAAGGIKSLGGAKIKLVIADAGRVRTTRAPPRSGFIGSNPNIVGGAGAYISSQQLAITEITERAGIPWLVQGQRRSAHRARLQVRVRHEHAERPGYRAGGSDDGAAREAELRREPEGCGHPRRQHSRHDCDRGRRRGGPQGERRERRRQGSFAIQLADGSVIAQRLRRARPAFIFFSTAIAPDTKTILTSLAQVGITPKNTPFFIYGGGAFDPEMLNLMPKEGLEGTAVFTNVWPTKKSGDLEARWKQRTGLPWMTFDPPSATGTSTC
jgi:branched-chain amino acid transport system substrate-binding protein